MLALLLEALHLLGIELGLVARHAEALRRILLARDGDIELLEALIRVAHLERELLAGSRAQRHAGDGHPSLRLAHHPHPVTVQRRLRAVFDADLRDAPGDRARRCGGKRRREQPGREKFQPTPSTMRKSRSAPSPSAFNATW